MAFVESGAVERFGLGNEHIALACASHSGEKRHVETAQAWLAKVGLSEADLECGTHAPRLQGTIEELARAGRMPTPAFNNCSGKHSGFLTTAVQYGEPTKDYIKYNHPVQRRLREVMSSSAPSTRGRSSCRRSAASPRLSCRRESILRASDCQFICNTSACFAPS